jgi:hypothetical protein
VTQTVMYGSENEKTKKDSLERMMAFFLLHLYVLSSHDAPELSSNLWLFFCYFLDMAS